MLLIDLWKAGSRQAAHEEGVAADDDAYGWEEIRIYLPVSAVAHVSLASHAPVVWFARVYAWNLRDLDAAYIRSICLT